MLKSWANYTYKVYKPLDRTNSIVGKRQAYIDYKPLDWGFLIIRDGNKKKIVINSVIPFSC